MTTIPLVLFIALSISFTTTIQSASASHDSEHARRQAEEILNGREYRQSNRPLSDDVERLSRWLGDGQDERVQQREEEQVREQSNQNPPRFSPPAVGGLNVVAQVILYLGIAAVIGAIGYLIYKIISARGANNKLAPDDDTSTSGIDIDWSDEEAVLSHITDADELERLSDQAERAGQFDIALRYRFRAGLLRLNDRNIISFHPSVTNAQWQLMLNDEQFNSLTRDFNDITYGQKQCDVSIVDRAKNQWRELLGSGPRGSR